MKAKTIKSVIRKKINEWLETIEDEHVRDLARLHTIVTGGCIASMLLAEPVNDFDVYFSNYETAFAVANYYLARFTPKLKSGIDCAMYLADENNHILTEPKGSGRIKVVVRSAGVASEEGTDTPYAYFEGAASSEEPGEYVGEIMQDPGDIEDTYQETEAKALATKSEGKPAYRPIFISTNAITLSDKIQIILRFYGEPDEIHDNYDYVHCTNYWKSGELILRPAALESLLTRELRYVGSKYPVCSLIRMRKFVRRNWQINAGQILKMCMQVSQLDLTDVKVLEDQLTGVDVAYFLELIHKLKEKDPEKVNYAYLVEIIERMF